MPPATNQYTLFGFSPELDWRKLRFVNPIPPNRICGACGLVRKRTVLLPCVHVLCDSCFQQCAQGGSHVCPLDGRECQDENDVDWREFPTEQLLKREVRCWNASCGCETVTTASEICRHYQRECEHHIVSCPKCSSAVLYSELSSHLWSGCSKKEEDFPSANQDPCTCNIEKGLTSLRVSYEKQMTEIRLHLQRAAAECVTRGDQLNEVVHSMNNFVENIKQEFGSETQQNHDIMANFVRDVTGPSEEVKTCLTAFKNTMQCFPESMGTKEKKLTDELNHTTSAIRDHPSEMATAMRTDASKNAEMVAENLKEISAEFNLERAFTIFSVAGVKSLEETVLKERTAHRDAEKTVYLRGYCILPGITLQKRDKLVRCRANLTICKGEMDDIIQWPFNHNIRMSVMHPKGRPNREREWKTNRVFESYQKPTKEKCMVIFLRDDSMDLTELIESGYIENDMLRLKFELLPTS